MMRLSMNFTKKCVCVGDFYICGKKITKKIHLESNSRYKSYDPSRQIRVRILESCMVGLAYVLPIGFLFFSRHIVDLETYGVFQKTSYTML